jgi:hypothetical protein
VRVIRVDGEGGEEADERRWAVGEDEGMENLW